MQEGPEKQYKYIGLLSIVVHGCPLLGICGNLLASDCINQTTIIIIIIFIIIIIIISWPEFTLSKCSEFTSSENPAVRQLDLLAALKVHVMIMFNQRLKFAFYDLSLFGQMYIFLPEILSQKQIL